jgi:NAD(P)-dependent dehydrogenase (short-subunit alcohol dehydrogenase family)
MLRGHCAVITGSTRGIGAGIGRARGSAPGARRLLNGFGDADWIESLRAGGAAGSVDDNWLAL